MKPTRRLVLARETLSELTADELRGVAAGATVGGACVGPLTVLVGGCPSDPRVCEYYTQMC